MAKSDDTKGLEALSESALRDRYASNKVRIDELEALKAEDKLTLAEAKELRELATDSNAVIEAVKTFAPADAVADLPEVVVPKADDKAEAKADDKADDKATKVATFKAGEEAELAEALAAAAALSQAVSTRHDDGAGGDNSGSVHVPRGQTLVASAAGSQGPIAANQPINLADVASMVQAFAHDGGQQGKSVPLVNLRPAINAAAGAVSSDNSRTENTRIFAAQVRDALTAAADPFDICGPADLMRDVRECDNVDRYVSGWFRNIQSTHGKIEFYRSFGMADVDDGVVGWDQTAQDAIDPLDPDTWKPCSTIGCLPTVTVGVEAVTQCMTMPVFQAMTSPEALASAIHAIRAQTARVADGQLLRMYDDLSSAYTHNAAAGLGATIDVYDTLGRLMGMAAAANRQLDLSGYTLGIEVGLLQHLTLDNTMACNSRQAQEAAESLFGSLGIGTIKVTPDWSEAQGSGPWSALLPIATPGAAPAVLGARPTNWTVRLFDANDFAMLSPGGDTFGIVPDLANKRQNKVTWFGELYQGLAKLGCKPAFSLEYTNLTATGVRAACA